MDVVEKTILGALAKGTQSYHQNKTKGIRDKYIVQAQNSSTKSNAFNHYVQSTGQNVQAAAKQWKRDKPVELNYNK